MASANAVSIWPEIREKIERQTTPQQFATWFRNLALETVTDTKVVFSVPSRFHRDWIVTYYREHMERAVAEVLGSPRPIHLDVVPRDPAEATAPRRPARLAAGPGEGVAAPTARATPPPAAVPRVGADLPLTEGFDFGSFVVGGCNQLAAAAGHCLAQSAACDFELLLVVGGTGLGKTHLLQAIARAAMAQRPQRSVAYVRAENFVHDFMQVMGTGEAGKGAASNQFRDKWRRLDFVCFDDLHLLAGKLGTQQELLNTLNAWHDRGTRVVFAANGAPGDNLNLDPGLLARISGAFRVNLRMPDVDTRRELVLSKSKARGEALPDDVVSFLADLPASTVRELEGALTGVVAGSRLTGTPLTLRSARLSLQDDTLLQRPASSPDRILKAVCQRFEVTVADLCSPRRPQALSFARQCGMYLLRERTELSLSEIGALLGGRDHTTILHGIRKVEESVAVDSRVRDHLARLRQLLER